MPAYRSVWARNKTSSGAFGLRQMIDPALPATQLNEEPKFFDEEFAGGALGMLLPAPPIRALMGGTTGSVVKEDADAIALHYGRQIMHLVKSGYVLFSADPQSSASVQAARIKEQLSHLQKESRGSSEDKTHRINKRKVYPIEKLLRVLDAYDQEGLIEGASKRVSKTEIGKKIFEHARNRDEVSWHKLAEAAFQQAKKIAFAA